MMKNLFCILFALLAISKHLLARETTKSSEIIKKFNITQINEGDNQNFPNKDDSVSIHYQGSIPQTGEIFDSFYTIEKVLTFNLGQGDVIPCWEEILPLMSKGEKIRIICLVKDEDYEVEDGFESVYPHPMKEYGFELELVDFNSQSRVTQSETSDEVQNQDL